MTEQTSAISVQEGGLKADFIGAIIVTVVFAVAFITTFEWPAKAAMFPRVVTGAGLAMSVAFAVTVIVKWCRAKVTGYIEGSEISRQEQVLVHVLGEDQDAGEEPSEDVEYVFATAGRKAWTDALGWVALFLILIVTLGLFVSSGIFALVYLRWGGKRTWLFSVIYAVVLPVILLAMFRWLLFIPTPIGLLTGW